MSLKLPEAFQNRIKNQLGEEAEDFFEALNNTPSVSIRINPKKVKVPLKFKPVLWSKYGYYLDKRPSFVLDPVFHAGCYYVQEASSMLIEEVLRQLKLDTQKVKILDLCGAPGGKATNILSTVTDGSLVFTNEAIRSRADVLKENIFKWGYSNVVVTQNDPGAYAKLTGFFDAIVVDAPCSGEGLFRKDPSAIEQWSEQNLQLCSERQQRILHTIWPALKENGYLIYSTCTYNPEENEENIRRFIKSQNALSIQLDFSEFKEITENSGSGEHGYYAYPHKVRGEGFFVSVLQKKMEEPEFKLQKKNHSKQQKASVSDVVKSLVSNQNDLLFYKDHIISFPEEWHFLFEHILPVLNVVSAGIPVACVKQQNVIPEPALAVSSILNKKNVYQVNLTYREALEFLKKESISPQLLKKGHNLISYNNHGLGWVKKIDDRRTNNYFPREWRIRMDLPAAPEENQKLLPLQEED